MNWDETRQFLSPCFPERIQSELDMLLPGELREIRLRAERETVFITATRSSALPYAPGKRELEAMLEALSEHSLYARSDETGQGYCTLRGGHRMGLCGRVVHRDGGATLAEIGSVCIRIAGQWPGCADPVMSHLRRANGSMLVIGIPGSGKTTLLRDVARQVATGRDARQLAMVDERGELAACVGGVPQLDVGENTDVLSGLSKPSAISWLVRSMSPQVIVTDELGGMEDASAILDAISCGVSVCASVHGSSLQDAASRPALAQLMARRAFGMYVVLAAEGAGQIAAIYDRTGSPITAP